MKLQNPSCLIMPLIALETGFLKRLGGMLASAFAIYVVFVAMLVFIQPYLMYFPDPTPFKPEAHGLSGFARLDYQAADGAPLHGFYAAPVGGHRLTLVFFQGNAGHLGQRADKIALWRKAGYGVMLATYRGYHGNEGFPSEAGLYYDARAALLALQQRGVLPSDTVLYGESLGTGIAVQMASEGAYRAGLVLEAPYTSIPDVGAYRYPFVPIFWIMRDKFSSITKIRNIRTPLLIMRAAHDHTVPPQFAKKLFDAAPDPKQLLTNTEADHNTIYSEVEVVTGLFEFLRDVEAGATEARY